MSVIEEDSFDVEEGPSSPLPLTPTFERHPELWFSDGSVVLRAQGIHFRVHKTQMARHSAFFRDLFSLPQPPNAGEEMIEGCSVVELYDDPTDLANLLVALYDGLTPGNNDPEDFHVTSGILRLGTKYAVDKLRDRALAHLMIAWPTTLEGWDAREEAAREHEFDTGQPLYPSPIAVINLAREINAPSLLPAAFYDLSRFSFSQLFDPPPLSPPLSRAASPPPTSASLSIRDLQRLALGKEAASLAVSALIASLVRGPGAAHARKPSIPPTQPASAHHQHNQTCATPGACHREFAELGTLATRHYVCERGRGHADPLFVADELAALLGECGPCARSLDAWAQRERARLWRMLPAWFRVEGEF
ncbi:hypothetical protein PENSPDRAFT_659081 [Peniophora sp. CONT]|nr:hypothetical protein PENSPDRAFT_659081 [Peniophora sp. CONT]